MINRGLWEIYVYLAAGLGAMACWRWLDPWSLESVLGSWAGCGVAAFTALRLSDKSEAYSEYLRTQRWDFTPQGPVNPQLLKLTSLMGATGFGVAFLFFTFVLAAKCWMLIVDFVVTR